MGEFGDLGVVSDHEDGLARRVEAPENREDSAAGRRVQITRWLVGEQDGGLINQGAGDGDALSLAA